ncbi:MAG: AraC family transcriptional regulator [Alphaproteobacteria bacterium]|nr:AraC family transcriptional regulator [Alphaproteobacteria bacterium]
MDLLSDILGAARLRGRFYFPVCATGDWAVRVPEEPGAFRFHVLRRGTCWIGVGSEPAWTRLAEGDLAIVPHGAAQVLADACGRPALELEAALRNAGFTGAGDVRLGAPGGGGADLLCGACMVERGGGHPLFQTLPPLLVLSDRDLGPWIAQAFERLAEDARSARAGYRAIADRLFEILLAEAFRAVLARGGSDGGFLGAMAHPNIGRALRAMHEAPDRDWTLELLAGEAGLSRSRFAELFRELAGDTPLQYLARWRLEQARGLLLETRLGVAEIAHRVGYESLPAFTRSFKRHFGTGPGTLRREALAIAGDGAGSPPPTLSSKRESALKSPSPTLVGEGLGEGAVVKASKA